MTGERFVCRPMIGIAFVTDTANCRAKVDLADSGLPANKLGRLRPSRMRSSTIQSDGGYFIAFNSATVSSGNFTTSTFGAAASCAVGPWYSGIGACPFRWSYLWVDTDFSLLKCCFVAVIYQRCCH